MKLPFASKIFHRVSLLDKLIFTKHLAVMIKAGISLSESLEALGEQTRSKTFKRILSAVLADIENGQSLAKSLAKHPQVFDQFYISLIEVGEEAGRLEENLSFLAKHLAKDYNLRKKIQGAMLYPTLVFFAALIIGGFIAFFILPQFVDLFEAFDTELPMATKILLFIANIVKDYNIFIVIAFLAIILLFYLLLKIPSIKFHWHRQVLKLPLFGGFLTAAQLATFSRNLGIQLQSGVPIKRSLEVTSATLSNLKFKADLKEIAEVLAKGKDMGSTLEEKRFDEFPPIVAKMVAVGERTGNLGEMLLYLGDFYEEEIDNITKNLTTILEPILLLSIGLVVGFVAIAIISPIYQLTGSIRR